FELLYLHSFPTRRSSDLSEAIAVMLFYRVGEIFEDLAIENSKKSITNLLDILPEYANLELNGKLQQVKPELLNKGDIIIVNPGEDRKSTRLNSSHVSISY